jgi:hypothetical protein
VIDHGLVSALRISITDGLINGLVVDDILLGG